MSLPYNRKLISRAKELRKAMTPEEKKVWYQFLSKSSLRFQRQKTIGNFIVDFYCHAAKLAVEIDGSHHYEEDISIYDLERTKILNSFGIKVIRFSNSDVRNNFSGVCFKILEELPLSLHDIPLTEGD